MSQYLYKKFPALFFLLIASLFGCSPTTSETGTAVTVSLQIPEASQASFKAFAPSPSHVASIELVVTGEGMTEITDTFTVPPGDNVTRTFGVPSGSARIIAALVFDSDGNPVYGGQSPPFEVRAGVTTDVDIPLQPLLVNMPSELPRFSGNFVLSDVVGISPFVESAASANYTEQVGMASLPGEEATSENYTLR